MTSPIASPSSQSAVILDLVAQASPGSTTAVTDYKPGSSRLSDEAALRVEPIKYSEDVLRATAVLEKYVCDSFTELVDALKIIMLDRIYRNNVKSGSGEEDHTLQKHGLASNQNALTHIYYGALDPKLVTQVAHGMLAVEAEAPGEAHALLQLLILDFWPEGMKPPSMFM